MQQQPQKLADFIDLYAKTREEIFLKSTKNKTKDMKYKAFVKMALEKFNPMIRDYVQPIAEQMSKCEKADEITNIKVDRIPEHFRDAMLEMIDKQKLLDIAEKVYLFIDLFNVIENNITNSVTRAAIHYTRLLEVQHSSGGHIIGLNGQKLSGQ